MMPNQKRLLMLTILFAVFPIPLFTLNGYYLYSVWLIFYYMTLAVGWNIGLLGNVTSLANYGYIGLGAYSYALSLLSGVPIMLALVISGAVPLLAMFPITFLLKLKTMYFAVATFVVPLIISGIINLLPEFTGGGTGVYIPISLTLNQTQTYTIVATLAAISVGLTGYFSWSKYGLALRSIYDAEDAAEANGVNVMRLKIAVFLIPVFLAGIAGAALASSLSFFDTSVVFNVSDLLILILITLIGGSRTVFGPVFGAVAIVIVVLALNIYFPYSHLAILGLIVLVITLGRPVLDRYRSSLRNILLRR